jgi:High potential iron-sulfur protein
MNRSRRCLLHMVGAAPALLLLGRAVPAAGVTACFDLNKMPSDELSLRTSIGFKAQSSDSAKRCGTCTFFTAAAADCGKCTLLSGGAVATSSVCDSWKG